MVNSVGEWELDFVEEWLPAYVRDTIRSISPPSETGRPDILAWTPYRDGEFTVRSAYTAVAKLQTTNPTLPFFESYGSGRVLSGSNCSYGGWLKVRC